MDNPNDKLNQTLCESLSADDFEKAVLSSKRKKSQECSKVTIKPVLKGGSRILQAEYTYPKKVTHENLEIAAMTALCRKLLCEEFKQFNGFSRTAEVQVLASKPERPHITRKSPAVRQSNQPLAESQGEGFTSACAGSPNRAYAGRLEFADAPVLPMPPDPSSPSPDLSHNRAKNYILQDGVFCDFLWKLGIMGEDGKVFPRCYSKFRQINRYLEVVDDVFPELLKTSVITPRTRAFADTNKGPAQARPLRIIDFGCGKAYLTFALYHYLCRIKGLSVRVTGLDLKTDVIELCSKTASELGCDGLEFLRGDIADYKENIADMVVTLHACDTATDFALANAVSRNTKVIISVPCCQHELFKQIKNDLHQPMLKHGILKDRLTEYLTDGLRGLWLESKGYKVSMIEFTSLEHTARNIMIRAVRTGDAKTAHAKKARLQFDALCEFYGVEPLIGKL